VIAAATPPRTPLAPAGPFTDALYEAHSEYAAQLGQAVDDMRPILKGLDKRDELRGDRAEYEAIIADPTRLLARGSSAA
jgi:hypothetical protein